MIRLETETFLPAPPDAVWAFLADFPGYAAWNPGMRDGKGEAKAGGALAFTVDAPDGSGRSYPMQGKIVACDPPRELAWEGGPWPILTGRHYFRLKAVEGGTRLVHGEDFGGLWVWWAGATKIARFRPQHEAMNRGLATHLERRSGTWVTPVRRHR